MIERRNFLTLLGLGFLVTASPVLISAYITKDQHSDSSDLPHLEHSKSIFFYVATNGNNSWSGKLSQPNKTKTDGPFATLVRARNAIRELKQQQGSVLKQSITVFLRGGTYFLPETLKFTAEDSGTKDFLITYKGYRDEKVIISGGRIITGWKQSIVDGKELWSVKLSEVQDSKWFFRQLWVNGNRCTRARYPNKGYLKVAGLGKNVSPDTQWYAGQISFKYHPDDLKNWKSINQAEIVLMTRWLESRLPVTRVDEAEKIVFFDKVSMLRMDPGDLYYIENALEILDTPGEWYLDRNLSTLYYMPLPDEDMSEVQVIAPVLSKVIDLQADWKSGKFLEYLAFENLVFAHADWYYPQEYKKSGFGQAAYAVPGAIYCEGVKHCIWKNCTIAHVSNYGIELSKMSQYNQVISCDIFDLGAGGIKLGAGAIKRGSNGKNKIVNCHIYNGGLIFHGAVGIWIAHSFGNYVANNHIHNFYYTGISIGWVWGYAKNLAKDNIIDSNYIHHIGKQSNEDDPILNDKGAIYTLGVQPGTVIRSNIIHDIQAFNYGGWGIYLDEGSSQILVENNLVYRTRDGGFHLHYGKGNIIRNNIFAFGDIAQIRRSAVEGHLSFTFKRNIIYWNQGKLLEGKWQDFNFAIDNNLYWRTTKDETNDEISFVDLSWDEWQAKGRDKNSLIADPLFINPENGDFRLKSNSPAFKLGFKPFLPPQFRE